MHFDVVSTLCTKILQAYQQEVGILLIPQPCVVPNKIKDFLFKKDMPIYIYQVLTDDGSEGEIFEIEQSMTTGSLTKHPVTGQSIKRIYLPPNISKKHTPGQTQKKLDNRNIEKCPLFYVSIARNCVYNYLN